jgi:hypothetical protein
MLLSVSMGCDEGTAMQIRRNTKPSRQANRRSGAQDETDLHPPAQKSPAQILQFQRQLGNRHTLHLLNTTPLQRQDATTSAVSNPELEAFLGSKYSHDGQDFQLDYHPTGGAAITVRPISGVVTITLRLNIQWRNFTRAMRRQAPYNTYHFSAEQRKDFNWADAEKTRFQDDLKKVVHDAWSSKHRLECTTAGFEELAAGVVVNVQFVDADQAHTVVTAQKIPKGAPRFRSFVNLDDNTAVLDSRDPSENTSETVTNTLLYRQVGPFALNSAEITSPLQSQLNSIGGEISALVVPPAADGIPGGLKINLIGRASTPGSRRHNHALAEKRMENVAAGMPLTRPGGFSFDYTEIAGEQNAAADESWQRVDVRVGDEERNVDYNTAAHEAGHMFGLHDEYPEDDAPNHRFTGDRPSHFGDVESELGADNANRLLVGETGSILSAGNEVAPGHYVYFLRALEAATGKQWTIP